MILKEHIAIWENAISEDLCKRLIGEFEFWINNKNIHVYKGKDQFKKEGIQGRDDTQLYLERINPELYNELAAKIHEHFQEYFELYPSILTDGTILSNFYSKIQKTNPGGGYHIWHCENGHFYLSNRVCAWSLNLNTIPPENGGAIEFFHQKFSVQPKIGTLIIFPAGYTHTHRGGFLTGDKSKYIATGWLERQAPMNKAYED